MSLELLNTIRACSECKEVLPFDPKPILNFIAESRIIIIGQAPGIKVHETEIPWNDASGDRLRDWLGVNKDTFYNPSNFAIIPMGFCYPGKGKSGDKPPRPECAELWMDKVLNELINKKLTLLIGKYSQDYFLQDRKKKTLTETVKHYQEFLPAYFVLPHPSPRNNIWLKKNPWFNENLVNLKQEITSILQT